MSRKTKRLKQLKGLKQLEAEVSMKDLKIARLEQQLAGYQHQVTDLKKVVKDLDAFVPWRIKVEQRFDHRSIRFVCEVNKEMIERACIVNPINRLVPMGRIDYESLSPILGSISRQMHHEVVKELCK